MPSLQDGLSGDVRLFCDWLYGQESSGDTAVSATAKFAQHHVRNRPCVTFAGPARWDSIAGMKECARLVGPSVTNEQFETALAAYEAS